MELPVILSAGEDGYTVAECPVIPGCISQGRTRAEALRNIREAIELCLESRDEEGWELAPHYDLARVEIADLTERTSLSKLQGPASKVARNRTTANRKS